MRYRGWTIGRWALESFALAGIWVLVYFAWIIVASLEGMQ